MEAQLSSNFDDELPFSRVCKLTGVDPYKDNGSIDTLKINKMRKALREADIYYWVKVDGTLGTTWHHIHRAGLPAKNDPLSIEPTFDASAVS
jgi:hypothetical protein